MSDRPTPTSELLDSLWVPSTAMSDEHSVFDELRVAWVESFGNSFRGQEVYYGYVLGERTGALSAESLDAVKRLLARDAASRLLELLIGSERGAAVQPLVLTFDTEAERAAVIEAARRVAPASVGRAVGA